MTFDEAVLCDSARTPFGRFGGALATVRADDLAAIPIRALMERNSELDWSLVDDVFLGCANQAGEDNRNVARMALLLAGLPETVPGATTNRLCGSGMDAVINAARAIRCGEAKLMIAGGVESMSRAPYVMGKADSPFSRGMKLEDTTLGWRFVNPLMASKYGVDTMIETAENVAAEYSISREDQDAFAFRSQQRAARAQAKGFFADEIVPVAISQKRAESKTVDVDEHPRKETTLEGLAALKPASRAGGTVTAGECGRDQRWRGSDACCFARLCGGAQFEAAREGCRSSDGWRCASCDGDWSGFSEPEGACIGEAFDRADGCRRVERSVCGAGFGRDADAWVEG